MMFYDLIASRNAIEPVKPVLGQSLAPARHQGLSCPGLPASLCSKIVEFEAVRRLKRSDILKLLNGKGCVGLCTKLV